MRKREREREDTDRQNEINDPDECMPRLATYPLLILGADQITPLFDNPTQIDRVQRYENLSDLVVFREAIEVVDGKRQRLGTHLRIGHLHDNDFTIALFYSLILFNLISIRLQH